MITVDLPRNVVERIAEYERMKKTGQIVLNFNSGRVESYEAKEHTRIRTSETITV